MASAWYAIRSSINRPNRSPSWYPLPASILPPGILCGTQPRRSRDGYRLVFSVNDRSRSLRTDMSHATQRGRHIDPAHHLLRIIPAHHLLWSRRRRCMHSSRCPFQRRLDRDHDVLLRPEHGRSHPHTPPVVRFTIVLLSF